ncbi:MAG: LuxR C-terminal-related transcriptional regulator [Ilumatobacteraceae bacterium]
MADRWAPDDRQRMPIIVGKFRLPAEPIDLVARPRLVERVNDSERPIAIITGGPCSGKSVLAAQCATAVDDGVCVWVHLDSTDDRPARFWLLLHTALDRAAPGTFGDVEHALLRAGSDPAVLVTELVVAASTLSRPLVVVLDDLHTITDPAIYEGIGLLGEHLPPQMRLVITSRCDPQLPIARWSVQSRISQVRQSDLEFTLQETTALFRECGEDRVTHAELEELCIGTAGWVGALRLAILAMRDDDPGSVARTFNGGSRMVADLLISEVLDRQPADVRDFLLWTSLVSEFDADLANALTGRDDSAALLDSLVHTVGFIVTCADGRHYRYHPLLRDVLEIEFDRRFACDATDRRRKAADVAAARGATVDAVTLLLAIGETERAFQLTFSTAFEHWDRRDVTAMAAWIELFPKEYVSQSVSRMLDYAGAVGLAGRPDEAVIWLGLATSRMKGLDEPSIRDLRHADALHGISYATNALVSDDIEPGERALDAIEGGLDLGTTGVRVRPGLARTHLLLDQPESARLVLDRSVATDDLTESLLVPALRARVALRTGDLDEAMSLANGALAAARALGRSGHLGALDALSAIAGVLTERNRLSEASEVTSRMRKFWPAYVPGVIARIDQARVMAAQEGPGAGLAGLNEIGDLVPQSGRARLRFVVDAFEARWRIETGEYDRVAELIGVIGPGVIGTLLTARLDVALGRPDAAIRRLETADLRTRRDRITAELLLARAGSAEGRNDWQIHIERAVALAAPQRFLRIFIDEGPEVTRAARRAAEKLCTSQGADLAVALGGSQPSPSVDRSSGVTLTERERAVLRLLPSRMTNREIGRECFMSVNTVKTHLKNIYMKLGVDRRNDAIDRARALGLLPDHASGAAARSQPVS